MAAKSKPRSQKKIIYKPEVVLKAQPKKKPAPKVALQKPKKKSRKSKFNTQPLRRLLHKRVPHRLFIPIVALVLLFAVIVTGVIVMHSVKLTNQLLSSSAEQANVPFLIAKKEADLIRIIGTKTKRQSEIQNYQSAPTDLQAFMNKDYRQFKEKCVAAGQLPDDVGYRVVNVIYDSFAVINQNCNGTETAILKKFDSGWATIFSGNTLPSCSIINDFNIPQGASYYCEQNGVRYVNPNP